MEQAREKLNESSRKAFSSTYDMIINEGMEKGLEIAIEGLLKKDMTDRFIIETLGVIREQILKVKNRLTL